LRPGSEVSVATPLGVVRYGDSKIEIEVSHGEKERLVATAWVSAATFVPAQGVRIEEGDEHGPAAAWTEVPMKAGVALVAVRPPVPLPRLVADLVHACTREMDAAVAALRALSEASSNGGDLGERAAAHVRARKRARAACESARAAAGLEPSVLDGALGAELRTADEKRNQLTPLPTRR
jgi:hypothetical protein